MSLRPYQRALLINAREHACRLSQRGNRCPAILIQLPTGGGKTHLIVALCAAAKGRTLVVVHRSELWRQARDKLRAHGLRVGVFAAGHDEDHDAPIVVASVQTLVARGVTPGDFILAILDEAHHAVARTWRAVLDACRGTLRSVIGVTATPARYDGTALSDVFDALVCGPSIQELQALDPPALCAIRVMRPAAPTTALSRDPLEVLLEHRNRPSVTFTGTVQESRTLVARAAASGLRLLHVDGNTRDRDERLAELGSAYDGVVNADVLTEGWDWPVASLCVLAGPLGSATRLLQRTGRVARPAPGKLDALVYDLLGATHTLGVPGIDDYHWSLGTDSGRVVRASVPVGTCRKCLAAYPYRPVCPRCGHRNPPPPARKVKWREVDEATREAVYARRDPVEWLARTLVAARENDWKRGAVEHRFRGWARRWPTAEEMTAARLAASGGRG